MIEPIGRRDVTRCRVSLPVLGFGCTPLGGMYRLTTQEEAGDAVRTALRHGVDYFDVAPAYGFGLAEARLGAALAAEPALVSTKVGRLLLPAARDEAPDDIFVEPSGYRARMDYSRSGTRRSIEESLARLTRSSVAFAFVHDFTTRHDRNVPEGLFRQTVEQTIPELAALRDKGLVGGIGVGVNETELARRYVEACNIDVLMIAGKITLLDHSGVGGLLPACRQRNIAVIAAAPFNSGALGTEDRRYNYAAAPLEIVRQIEKLRAVAHAFDVPLAAVALQYPLRFEGVASVVVGMRSAAEVEQNVAHMGIQIPNALWSELESHRNDAGNGA